MPEQICEYCGKANPSRETYCYSCGMLLPAGRQAGDTRMLPPDAPPANESMGSALASTATLLRIHIPSMNDVVETQLQAECVLGRSGEGPAPDVDLTPYSALMLGVSRRHVKLTREGNMIMVQDLGGINGTYLNGRRLLPHQPRVLRSDDSLSLGQLEVRISFNNEPRTTPAAPPAGARPRPSERDSAPPRPSELPR